MVNQRIRTNNFSTTPEGDLEFNNGKPGSQLASFLRSAFTKEWSLVKDVIQEDYGWGFWIQDAKSKYWVAVGLQEDEQPNPEPCWLILAYRSKGLNPFKWFSHENRELEIIERAKTRLKEVEGLRFVDE